MKESLWSIKWHLVDVEKNALFKEKLEEWQEYNLI